MTVAIIITFCILLLIAYVFDISASKTKIPPVILLLLLGWVVQQGSTWAGIQLPDVSSLLPVLGTVGLILIVLEGSLELELNRSKLKLIKTSFLGALVPMGLLAFLMAAAFHQVGGYGWKDSLTNAVPLCVISSAIAIPSARNLFSHQREFVIYESSLSDILGVLLFNFLALNETINAHSFGHFALQLLMITLVSFAATLALSFLLHKIDHHVKFLPIILLVVLIYTVSKIYHLPGLIFILFFGLFIGNLDELRRFKWIERFKPDELNEEVHKFKELTIEIAFLVRSLFFLLFGYLIKTDELFNGETFIWALAITGAIFGLRALQLKLSKIPLHPLLFIAPRGLITILLFLSIEPSHTIALVNQSLILQVILLSALFMMVGLMTHRTKGRAEGTAAVEN